MLRTSLFLLAAGLASAALFLGVITPQKPVEAALFGEISRTHDPSRIVECAGKYYLFYTGNKLPSRVSSDKINWTRGADILAAVPEWMHGKVPAAKGDFVWAPDVIFWRGQYFLFYSYSTFGSKTSAIGLLTSPTLDPKAANYAWKEAGLVVSSTQQSDFNAIDPAPIIGADDALYLSFGSWNAGGIKVVKLDDTSKPSGELKTIAAGQSRGPEAPYLHGHDGTYTLFANHETCCAGMNSTYRVVMGQSKSPLGPFLDREGRDMAKGGGSAFLETEGDRIGPGHIGILEQNGLDTASFHFYDGQKNGTPTLGIEPLWWDAAGWPHLGRELMGGRYVLESKASGLALGVKDNAGADGAPLDQFRYLGAAQSWNIAPTGDGFYSLRSTGTGKFMDLAGCSPLDGAKIGQAPWNNNGCQRWSIEQTGAETYRLIAKGAKTALSLPDDAKLPQQQAVGAAWKGTTAQQWILRPLPLPQ